MRSNLTVHKPQVVFTSSTRPDGERGKEPFTVYCDMTDKNGVGVTVVGHDSEDRMLVNGFEDKGSYMRDVSYFGAGLTGLQQLAGLTSVSIKVELL